MLQLLKVLDIWTEILDEGGSVDIVYCDFMKAFDKVPHRRLIHKVRQYGITDNILGWIENVLNNRKQVTVINDHKSHTAPVTSGIPQGSVLGPILFVIYINDLPEAVDPSSHIFLFADDTKIFGEIKCDQDHEILQKDIDNMLAWSKNWLLKFHPEKCVMMSMGKNSASNKEEHTYTMEGHNLNYSSCEKDLGVYIDEDLSFDIHISQAINKANRVMAIARKTFDFMNEDIFLNIFKGLVRPHLEYATAVWSPHLIKHIDDLENVQRRATKQIPNFSSLSYADRLRKLGLPTLSYRRIRGDLIQVFKMNCEDGGYDNAISSVFQSSQTKNLRGHSKKLFMKNCNKNIRRHSFSHRVISLWNSLPEQVISAKDQFDFEKKLDAHWKTQPVVYDDYKAKITCTPTDLNKSTTS